MNLSEMFVILPELFLIKLKPDLVMKLGPEC